GGAGSVSRRAGGELVVAATVVESSSGEGVSPLQRAVSWAEACRSGDVLPHRRGAEGKTACAVCGRNSERYASPREEEKLKIRGSVRSVMKTACVTVLCTD
ncbi:hypothetical protein B484DRAFT_409943, partial [Ochromonadaceae sp. CCMP2298]